MKENKLSRPRILTLTMGILFAAFLVQGLLSCNQTEKVKEGSELYASYCLMCHGETGVGNGPMADLLKNPPLDLTKITERHGKFPTDEIVAKVSGKQDIMGHGESEMPIFWVVIKNGENLTDDHEVEERINEIVAYLKKIQK